MSTHSIVGVSQIGESTTQRRLLLLDDDAALLQVVSRQLTARGFEVSAFEAPSDAIDALNAQQFDAAVLDFSLDGMTGLEVMERLRAIDETLTIVLLTGTIKIPAAVNAIRRGAEDVLTKPVSADRLQVAVERGLVRTRLQRSRQLLAAHVVDPYGTLDQSPVMQRVVRQAQHAARLELPVLLVGEAGTGKRAIAEMIHQISPHDGRRFVAVNLLGQTHDAIDELLTAILSRPHLAQRAKHTTLYLDDLSTLGDVAQRALLNALEPSSPFRVIASTRLDLTVEVRASRMLPALQQRLSTIPIAIPALRERGAAAIRTLATRILDRLRIEVGEGPDSFSEAALAWLANCEWPANIAQLRAVIAESFVRAVGESQLETHHLTPSLEARALHAGSADRDTEDWSLRAAERRQILSVLGMTGNNRSHAARLLGITRTTLYKKMDEYALLSEE